MSKLFEEIVNKKEEVLRKRKRELPELVLPSGYTIDELLDMDDSGYDFEESVIYEEVKITYERYERTKQRI